MKKRNLLSVISLGLVASVAIAGTAAYLTDTDEDKNVMTLGKVEIDQKEYERVQDADGNYTTSTIDGKTSYELKLFDDETKEKPLLPVVGDPNKGEAGWDATTVRMTQVGSYGGMQVFDSNNVQDKFVTVTNTGASDAYVRTLVAFEYGEADPNLDPRLVRMSNHITWKSRSIGIVKVNGENYDLYEFEYLGGELSDGSWRHKGGLLPAGETSYPNLSQVYLGSEATNEDVDALDANDDGKLNILVFSQAVQAAGFDDAKTALDKAFGETTVDNTKVLEKLKEVYDITVTP